MIITCAHICVCKRMEVYTYWRIDMYTHAHGRSYIHKIWTHRVVNYVVKCTIKQRWTHASYVHTHFTSAYTYAYMCTDDTRTHIHICTHTHTHIYIYIYIDICIENTRVRTHAHITTCACRWRYCGFALNYRNILAILQATVHSNWHRFDFYKCLFDVILYNIVTTQMISDSRWLLKHGNIMLRVINSYGWRCCSIILSLWENFISPQNNLFQAHFFLARYRPLNGPHLHWVAQAIRLPENPGTTMASIEHLTP